jgi:hypothetical protein
VKTNFVIESIHGDKPRRRRFRKPRKPSRVGVKCQRRGNRRLAFARR